jgi:DNA-binding HxlR family transcriptional regulator
MPGKFDELYERVPIRALEAQAGILQVMLYLQKEGEVNFQKIVENAKITGRSLYGSLEKLKKLGLIKERIDSTSYPPKNMISLTQKGNEVATKLKEINMILSGVK